MSVHIEDLASAIYFYGPGESYKNGDEPKAIASMCRVDHGAVEILATKGELTRTDVKDVIRQLTERGHHLLIIKRRKGHRMPYGKCVRSDKAFDYYHVDLA